MKKTVSVWTLSLLLGITLPCVAQNQQETNRPPEQGTSEPVALMSEVVEARATVQDVSTLRRLVTLKEPNGNTIRLKLGKEQEDLLKQLKKGDELDVKFYRSAAVKLAKQGETPTGREEAQFVLAPDQGGQPGKVIVKTITETATVEDIDPKSGRVTLKEADGRTIKVKADKSSPDLARIKKGDKIVATYTEAAAISVARKTK